MSQPASKQAIAFILITVLIDTIGFGIVLPVLPDLIMELTGETVSQSSLDGGRLAFAYAVMQFLFGPIMGNLSDRFGRRIVLLLSLFAFGVDYALMGFAPSLTWLFVGRIVAGIAGAAQTTANAYVADVSPPEKRAQNFGLIGAAFGVGFILGPALGGLLAGFGTRAPFFAAAALALTNFAYGLFVLPESLPVERRRPFSWKRANTLGTLIHLNRYPTITGLAAALFLWQLAHQVLPTTWAFYTKLKFDWTAGEIGWSLAFAGVAMALTQGWLTRIVLPRWGERRTVLVGFTVGALAFMGYALANTSWLVYVCIACSSLMGLAYPSMNALMSHQVPASAQGELQGGLASMHSLTAIIGPLLMTELFGYFTSPQAPVYFPGAAFALASLLTLGCIALFVRTIRRAPQPTAAARTE